MAAAAATLDAWTCIELYSYPSVAHAEPRLCFLHAAALRVGLRGGLAEQVAPERRAVHARLRARRRAEGSGVLAARAGTRMPARWRARAATGGHALSPGARGAQELAVRRWLAPTCCHPELRRA